MAVLRNPRRAFVCALAAMLARPGRKRQQQADGALAITR